MQPSFSTKKITSSRKEHVCCECKSKIKIGEKKHVVSGCWDGELASMITCLDCHNLFEHLNDNYDFYNRNDESLFGERLNDAKYFARENQYPGLKFAVGRRLVKLRRKNNVN